MIAVGILNASAARIVPPADIFPTRKGEQIVAL
jgi:hypothetical protein